MYALFPQVDASPTRSYDGSGLGLVISKRLAEAMGGRMWAESAGPGRGSTFSWSIAVKVPPPSVRGSVSTLSKHRRSNVLLPATKKDQRGSDGGAALAMPDSDETSSAVSSDAGTWPSGTCTSICTELMTFDHAIARTFIMLYML